MYVLPEKFPAISVCATLRNAAVYILTSIRSAVPETSTASLKTSEAGLQGFGYIKTLSRARGAGSVDGVNVGVLPAGVCVEVSAGP